MANKTVVFTNYFLNGTSGLTLLLLDPETAAIGNGAGDTLTAGSNGLFSAVVTEAITGWWNIVVLQGAVVVLEGGKVYFPSDTLGTYQVDDANSPTTVGTINPNTITSSALASSAVDEIVDAVYDEPMSGHTVNGSYGSHLVRSANQNQNTVQITGSQHIAADMHESQAGAIHTTTFDAGAITSTVLATDCITSDELSASAIAEIAAAASVTVNVTPLQATEPDRITPSGIQTLINDLSAIGPIAIKDSSGDPVSLAGLTLKVCIERIDGTVLANLTPTVSGASNNQITFTPNADSVAKTGTFRWALRQVSDGKVYGLGEFIVDSAAKIAP